MSNLSIAAVKTSFSLTKKFGKLFKSLTKLDEFVVKVTRALHNAWGRMRFHPSTPTFIGNTSSFSCVAPVIKMLFCCNKIMYGGLGHESWATKYLCITWAKSNLKLTRKKNHFNFKSNLNPWQLLYPWAVSEREARMIARWRIHAANAFHFLLHCKKFFFSSSVTTLNINLVFQPFNSTRSFFLSGAFSGKKQWWMCDKLKLSSLGNFPLERNGEKDLHARQYFSFRTLNNSCLH